MLATHNRASLWKLVCDLFRKKNMAVSGEDSWMPGSFRKGRMIENDDQPWDLGKPDFFFRQSQRI